MEMLFGLLIVGFFLLIKGADWLVTGASSLAKRFNVSELAIGLTIVAFGTSAPELIVNIIASTKNYDDVVLGNVIGSNLFNLLLILGVSGIVSPIVVQSKTVWREIPFSFLAVFILFVLANDSLFFNSSENVLTYLDGFIFLLCFLGFVYYVFRNMKNDSMSVESTEVLPVWNTIFKLTIGLGGLIFGGKLVVDNAVEIAHISGVSERVIGLTIVSVGTSLPELATSVIAASRNKSDLAIGNVIGSNIFNVFLILGSSAVIAPVSFALSFNVDLVILAASTVFLFVAMFTGVRKKLDRWEAVLLFMAFLGYITFTLFK